jgi:Family of unknown function (DUF5677)
VSGLGDAIRGFRMQGSLIGANLWLIATWRQHSLAARRGCVFSRGPAYPCSRSPMWTPRFVVPELKTFPIKERLSLCRELAELARRSLEGTGPAGGWEGERLKLAVWARAAGTFDAVILLADQGYGDQVGMLARALFESAIDVYWIARYPVKAQRLAELHMRLMRMVVAEHWNANERRDGDPLLPILPEDIRERDRLVKYFGSKATRHWTRQTLPERIAVVSALVPQDRNGELMARYADDNRLVNLLLHGAAVALNDRISNTGPDKITIHVGASEQHLANGLRHAYWSYQRLVLLAAKRRNPSAVPEIEQLYRTAWPLLQTITAPALKKAGPDGDCPCGSGRRAQVCHGRI